MNASSQQPLFATSTVIAALSVAIATLLGLPASFFMSGGGDGWTGAVVYSLSAIVLATLASVAWVYRRFGVWRGIAVVVLVIGIVADLPLVGLAADPYFQRTVLSAPVLVVVWSISWFA